MSNRKFTNAERFAVWKHHGQQCYWCKEPLRLQDTTVDHLLPEHLEDKPKEAERLKTLLGLSNTFKINDYCNWLPAHDKCNKNKGGKPLPPTPMVLAIFEKLQRDADVVRKIEAGIKASGKKDKALATIMVAVEKGDISKNEILAALSDPDLPQDEDVQLMRKEITLRLDSKRWHIVHLDEDRGLATVSDGHLGGSTPIGSKPHYSWECPHCGSYGPWNGARCMTCGHLSDPYD
jgi:hypothetical protein